MRDRRRSVTGVARTGSMALVAVMLLTLVGAAAPASARQENDPGIIASLSLINTWRGWLGIPPLKIDPALQKAAEAHVEYYRLNFGDPSLAGMGLHYETAGKPGFTGASFQERVETAGYSGWANENAGLSGSMVWSTKWFIGTVGHRLTLLDPRYSDIGLAAINDGKIKFEIIDLGTKKWIEEASPDWAAWPPNGATGVETSFDGEAPDPFPNATYPVGYPITLKYFGAGDLTLTVATISAGGVAVPSFSSIGSGWLTRKTIQLAANKPLDEGKRYDIHVEGTANGQRFVRDWSFTTTTGDDELDLPGTPRPTPPPAPQPTPTPTPSPPPTRSQVPLDQLPDGLKSANALVQQLWWETDGPVARTEVDRSWLWGPNSWSAVTESYAESPAHRRQVYYFDKARMEVNDATGQRDGFVTAGLLVRDMILGKAQVGDAMFENHAPADVPLAGDEKPFNRDAPTFASLAGVASIGGGHTAAARRGAAIREVLSSRGAISTNNALGNLAAYGSYEPTLGHNIAAVFDDYLAGLPNDWMMSVGLPLTEPYWIRTNVAGVPNWVLVQAFERRVLTYTPDNPAGWQVEMGNVGRAYYTWRYGVLPPWR